MQDPVSNVTQPDVFTFTVADSVVPDEDAIEPVELVYGRHLHFGDIAGGNERRALAVNVRVLLSHAAMRRSGGRRQIRSTTGNFRVDGAARCAHGTNHARKRSHGERPGAAVRARCQGLSSE